MDLYLIRHGLAGQAEDRSHDPTGQGSDDDRPLTPEGQVKTRRIADRLNLLISVDLIVTSPLMRAQQTAQILQRAGLGDRLERHPALAPGGAIEDWLTWLDGKGADRRGKVIALVGHRPDLGHWAEQLIWGGVPQVETERLVIKKAGVVGLHLPDVGSPIGQSQLFWLAPPRLLLR
jgi:phosphohistidine phosphatase